MHLTVMPIRQVEPEACWGACLRMVLHFYGIDIAYEDIDRFVLNDDHGGTMLTELGRFALS